MIQTEMFYVRGEERGEVDAQAVLEAFDTIKRINDDLLPFDSTTRYLTARRWTYAAQEAEGTIAYAKTDPAAIAHEIAGLLPALHRFVTLCHKLHRQEQLQK